MSGDKVPSCPTDTAAEASDNGGGGRGSTTDVDDFKLETAPFDPRFPNTNQAKNCAVNFLDYQRCIKLRGEDYQPCQYFKRVYTSICPISWIAKWEQQIEEGRSPFVI